MRKVTKSVGINSQPRSVSEEVKSSRDDHHRTNNTFLVCKKKMLWAIGGATLVVKWNDGEMSSADIGHAGEIINKRIN
jgi:hypothetical protein